MLSPDTKEETTRLFKALSEGGTGEMELADTFWNAYYGSCKDKFGVQWMFNFHDLSRVFFVLFTESPSSEKAKTLMAEDYGDEKLFICKSAGYMYIPGNAARSILSKGMPEKKPGVTATTRNFNTMRKVIEWSRE